MGLPKRDAARHTYGEYLRWPEEARYELIDGVAYAMAPAPSRRHQEVLLELARQVANALEGHPCRPFIAPFDVRLPRAGEADDEIDTVVQPDLSVVCDPRKLDDLGCRGAPDWIVEVLSPTTASHDHILKRAVYERAGVREYWLVHPVDRIVTVYRLDGARFGVPEVCELIGRQSVGVLPQIEIDWDRFAALFPQ
ncbi:Uma2 family endonuclease [Pelomicrobium methylotrophicum]|uniref:Uma2 family endonuclease n=1 Tax=Pelomicrobium methylotrophicum TaxID=2602750 RepID=A0A5C7EPK3_9PROT|nr:Uma2 family endonuclease [Pelomicrobium methylotrophicum]TXF13336.1 Uma2 family endonuclease [Pelomicrobium methylotrophicum]